MGKLGPFYDVHMARNEAHKWLRKGFAVRSVSLKQGLFLIIC